MQLELSNVECRIENQVIKYTFDNLKTLLQPRQKISHKGSYGHVLIIGGDYGFVGAVMMSAEAALRTGAGLVTVATRTSHISCVASYRPEIMCHGIDNIETLKYLIKKATTIVLGPGLGESAWSNMLFDTAIDTDLPVVLDADGLNILAKTNVSLNGNFILTPHEGEAARLIGCSADDIQYNRISSIYKLKEKYKKSIILKGHGTLILNSDQEMPVLCECGNPGMSSGGTGDVLSGVIGGLLAQGFGVNTAAVLGVYIHSFAADKAAIHGERGMIATDLMPYIRGIVNPSINSSKSNCSSIVTVE